jgi:hypothetical protein
MSNQEVEIARLQEKIVMMADNYISLKTEVEDLEAKVDALNTWKTWLFGIGAGLGFGLGVFGSKFRSFLGIPD